jgi:hypothetical protein
MDTDIREMLKQNLELARENNRMLKKLIRKERWASLMRILYWLVILGVTLATYYYLQPYIEDAIGLYDNVGERIDDLREVVPARSEIE